MQKTVKNIQITNSEALMLEKQMNVYKICTVKTLRKTNVQATLFEV